MSKCLLVQELVLFVSFKMLIQDMCVLCLSWLIEFDVKWKNHEMQIYL